MLFIKIVHSMLSTNIKKTINKLTLKLCSPYFFLNFLDILNRCYQKIKLKSSNSVIKILLMN